MASARERLEIEVLARDFATRILKRVGATSKREGKSIETSFLGMDRGAQRFASRIRDAAVALVGFAAAVRAIRSGVREFLELDRALAEVSTILPETAGGLAEVKEEAEELALRLGEHEALITKGFYQTLSSGITDAADAMTVLTESAELGVAGLATTEQSVDAVTNILNAYKKEASEAAKVTDVLFKTVELGKTRIPEIAGSLGSVIPLAAQLKIRIEEVNAAIVAQTLQGATFAEGTTRLTQLLALFLKRQSDLDAILKDTGGFDLQRLAADGLTVTLNRLRDAVGENVGGFGELAGRKEALLAFLALTGENADTLRDSLAAIDDAAGAADRALAKQLDSAARRVDVLRSGVRQGLAEIGREFVETFLGGEDALLDAEEAAKSLKEAIAALGPPLRVVAGTLGAIAVGAQGIAVIGGAVGKALGIADEGAQDLADSFVTLAEANHNLLTGQADFTATSIVLNRRRREAIRQEEADLRSLAEASSKRLESIQNQLGTGRFAIEDLLDLDAANREFEDFARRAQQVGKDIFDPEGFRLGGVAFGADFIEGLRAIGVEVDAVQDKLRKLSPSEGGITIVEPEVVAESVDRLKLLQQEAAAAQAEVQTVGLEVSAGIKRDSDLLIAQLQSAKAQLKVALEGGTISADQFRRSIAALNKELEKAERSDSFGGAFADRLSDLTEEFTNLGNLGRDFADLTVGTFEDFGRAAAEGGEAMERFKRKVVADIAAIVTRAAGLAILREVFGVGEGGSKAAKELAAGGAVLTTAGIILKPVATDMVTAGGLLLAAAIAFKASGITGLEHGGVVDRPLLGTAKLPGFEHGGMAAGKLLGTIPLGGRRLSARAYDEGGIASDPTLAVFGEGSARRHGEAFVPLGPGRRIPVELRGAAPAAGSGQPVTVNISVHALDARSAADVFAQPGVSQAVTSAVANGMRLGTSRELIDAVREVR